MSFKIFVSDKEDLTKNCPGNSAELHEDI